MRARYFVLALVAGCGAPPPAPPDLARPAAPPIGALDGKPIAPSGQLAGGTPVVQRLNDRWQPLAPPPGLDERSRLALTDGSFWVWMSFASEDGVERARWIAPAHSREELQRRLDAITTEAKRLPAALATRVMPELSIIASISVVEGDFGDPSTHVHDPAGSIGIFQWAADRKSPSTAGSSLARFFTTLARRAAAAEDPLFVRAWKQCRARGLSIKRGELWLGKKRANAAQVEEDLHADLGEGALRTYQLVAAADWIDDVRATVVRPGARGAAWLGHAYAEANGGRYVTMQHDGHKIALTAARVVTVGELLPTGSALASAVSIGVNRPSYVAPALWRALGSDPTFTLDPARIWPTPAKTDEQQLAIAFRRQVLALYPPDQRDRRARRLATALLLEQ